MNKRVALYMVAVFFLLASTLAPAGSRVSAAASRLFPETGKTVNDPFLSYWDSHGRLAQQGYPITNETNEKNDADGKTYKTQYFERARFEHHPENKDPKFQVLLGLLGKEALTAKYGNKPPSAPKQVVPGGGSRTFSETGKTVTGLFLDYWEKNGGLAQQGFPITEAYNEKNDADGKTYITQYFERARFEYHPENADPKYKVLLGLVGKEILGRKQGTGGTGGTPPPPGEVPPGPLTVVALGDSLTEGDGDQPGDGGGYPVRIERAINDVRPDSQVINLGKSGWDSEQMVEGQLPDALKAKPHIALVWIGSNDLWYNNGPDGQTSDVARYTNNIDRTLRALTGAGARVFIALLDDQSKRPFTTNPDGFGLSPEGEGVEHMSRLGMAFNDVIRAKATEYGATTVDFYNTTIFTDRATLADDGLHPNAKGYDVIAQIWFKAIRPVLK